MSATEARNVMRWGLFAVAVAILAVAAVGSASAAEVTGAADNLRTGWYPDEPSLAPLQLTKARFKQAFEAKLKGQIYAQPLVANGILLIVTEENWAYGLDPVTGDARWAREFGTAVEAGEEPGATIKCPDLQPRVGITGTPVIDAEHNVAYFVANRYVLGSAGEIAWYMNAVKLDTGEEVPNFPVKIEGEAQNLAGVKFMAAQELQRPALLMMNGVVYAGFGSHCDTAPFEGWIAGVSTVGQLTTLWATSAHGGSIWQSGGGLVSDGPGQILFSTGNDSFEPGVWDPPVGTGKQTPEPEGKLGESVVRVQAQPGGELKTSDYFSPFNTKELDEKDLDIGSWGPVALPSPYFGNAEVPHLLVQAGKAGSIYLLNRDELGGRGTGTNNVVQELKGFAGAFGTAGVWPGEGGYVDLITDGGVGHLHFFKYGETSGKPALGPQTQTSETLAFGSGSPIITSSGTASGTGVLWITWCPESACEKAEAELRAYNPAGKEATPLWREKIGFATKFSRPGVSNGHVYVGNHEGHVIGFSGPSLTPSSESLELAAPVGGQATREVTLTSTGSEIELEKATPPTAPFQASGLPPMKTKLKPGEAIRVAITFKPSARGPVSGQFSVGTEAGETKIALLGVGEESAQEKAEREAREKPPGTATTVSFVTPPALGLVNTEPLVSLTKLMVRSRASRLGTHGRKLVISYTLSTAGRVQVVIYRRVTSHSCHRGVRTCSRWVATKLKLKVAGHAGSNLLAVNLGTLAAGSYRLAATPVNRSGAPGVTRTVEFRTFH
jgi:outer membrane protein assembly factor BamB